MAKLFELFGEIVINNAEANKAIDTTSDKAKTLADNLNEASQSTKEFGDNLDNAGKKADDAGDKFGDSGKFNAAAVALGNLLSDLANKAWDLSKQLFDIGITYNANMEYYHASISSMMSGDAEAAAKLIGQLQELSVNTPLHFLDLMKNTQTMLSYGIEAENVIGLLTMMGDITHGNTEKMNGFAYALSQVAGYKKLRAQEVNQMINAGFPVWEYLAKYLDVSEEIVQKMGEKNEITFLDVVGAMQLATSEGETFYGQMDRMMSTYNAQWEKIKETTEITAATLTEPLFEVLRDDTLPKLQGLLERFSSFLEENPDLLQSWADTLGAFAENGLESLLNLFEYILTNKDAVIAAIDAIGAAFLVKLSASHPYLAVLLSILDYVSGETAKGKDLSQLGFYGLGPDAVYKENFVALTQEEYEELLASPFSKYKHKEVNGEDHFDLGQNREINGYGVHTSFGNYKSIPVINSSDPIAYTQEYINTYLKNDLFTPTEIENMVLTISAELETNGEAEEANKLMTWWEGVKSQLNLTIEATVVPSYVPANFASGVRSNEISTSHATGLDYVPRDNYLARLHQGEAVLTAKENSEYRRMKNGGNIESAIVYLTEAISELQAGFQANMNLYVNKKHVASAMSRDMGRSIGNREYALMRGMGG